MKNITPSTHHDVAVLSIDDGLPLLDGLDDHLCEVCLMQLLKQRGLAGGDVALDGDLRMLAVHLGPVAWAYSEVAGVGAHPCAWRETRKM